MARLSCGLRIIKSGDTRRVRSGLILGRQVVQNLATKKKGRWRYEAEQWQRE